MNWDRFWDLMEEPCIFSSEPVVVRKYTDRTGRRVEEIIPVSVFEQLTSLEAQPGTTRIGRKSED
jgi:hypothetical protein